MRDVLLCLPSPLQLPLQSPQKRLWVSAWPKRTNCSAQKNTTAPPAPTSRPPSLLWGRRTPSHHHASIHGQGPSVSSTGPGYCHKNLVRRRKWGRKRQDELSAHCSSSTPSPGAVPAPHSQHFSPDLTSVFTYIPKNTPSSSSALSQMLPKQGTGTRRPAGSTRPASAWHESLFPSR